MHNSSLNRNQLDVLCKSYIKVEYKDSNDWVGGK